MNINRLFSIIACCLVLSPLALGRQDLDVPRDLDTLLLRARELRSFLADGRLVESLPYILPDKRNEVMAAGRTPFRNPRVVGLDLTPDPDRINVRVEIQIVSVEGGVSDRAFTVQDLWVRLDGEWFFDVESFNQALESNAPAKISAGEAIRLREEFEEVFSMAASVDAGRLMRAASEVIPVPVQFSGDEPIVIEASLPLDLLKLSRRSFTITSEDESFDVLLDTAQWDGPLAFPMPLKIYYKGIWIDRSLTVRADIFFPLEVSISFDDLSGTGTVEVQIMNHTDQHLQVGYMSVDGRMEILDHSMEIEPQGLGFIRLRRITGVTGSSELLTVFLTMPLSERQIYSFPLELTEPGGGLN